MFYEAVEVETTPTEICLMAIDPTNMENISSDMTEFGSSKPVTPPDTPLRNPAALYAEACSFSPPNTTNNHTLSHGEEEGSRILHRKCGITETNHKYQNSLYMRAPRPQPNRIEFRNLTNNGLLNTYSTSQHPHKQAFQCRPYGKQSINTSQVPYNRMSKNAKKQF
jgi:hypothetical protein